MRRFLLKFLILLALLLVGQSVVAYIYPASVPEAIVHFQTLLDEQVDVIYMGDSTLWHPTGSQTTAAMLQELLPNQTIGELSHAAYGMDIYASYITYLLRQEYRPKLIIIPINMRSFSPEWERRPGYQFTMEKRILNMGIPLTRFLGRPLRLFGSYQTDITQDEFLRSEINNSGTPVGQVADFEDSVGLTASATQNTEQFVYYQELAADPDYPRLLTYYFMNALQPDHRKVRAMVEIVRALQTAGVDVLFYFTPVNVELGDLYIGEDFRRQFTANVDVIKAQIAAEGLTEGTQMLDFSYDLAAYFFSDTEHLRQPGKLYIAEQLATHIDPAAMVPVATQQATPVTPVVATTPADTTSNTAPANPLLATTVARATQAADSAAATTPVAPAPPSEATPIANPLLATAVMRATEAAQP